MTLTAKTILSIRSDEPGGIFTDKDSMKNEFRSLAKKWHPDAPDGSMEVFMKIKELYDSGVDQASKGIWNVPNVFLIKSKEGKTFSLKYCRKIPIDVGTMYYGPTNVSFVIDASKVSMADNGIRMIRGLKYADEPMRKEVSRFMPSIRTTIDADDGSRMIVIDKTSDVFLLRDVIDHFDGKVPSAHAAWMTSRLMGLACYLRWAGIAHSSITADTVFVSPKYHTALLLGGWWFSKEFDQKLTAVPKLIHSILPSTTLATKLADDKIDRLSIRALSREIFGDRTGMNLSSIGIPKDVISFLRFPLGKDAFVDNIEWGKAMERSFGPRKFVHLDIPESTIYST